MLYISVSKMLFSFLLLCTAGIRADDKSVLEDYISEAKLSVNQRYRLLYHVAAPVGWINDPNGFSYYNNEYHLFYQYYPYKSEWGPMHWGHVTSKDLVQWDYRPTALLPGEEMCFSGSAVDDNGVMVLMYTGHVITDTEPFYNQSQYIATSTDGVNFDKYEGNPVLASAPNGSPDFRDPKVWRQGDHWYVIIGSKTDDDRGRVLLYRSKDMIEWDFLKVLAESNGTLGYMWECPDFFELDGKFVLLISPQGIEPQGDRYRNTYQTGYIIGEFNYETFEFVPESNFIELDFGHDFYAAQTQLVFGRRLLVSWFGMWEVPHPEEEDGWSGAMTIFRELRIQNGRIKMSPVEEMKQLRVRTSHIVVPPRRKRYVGKAVELEIAGHVDVLLQGAEGGDQIRLKWVGDKVVLDRNGEVRQVEWSPEQANIRIFLDASSVEVFCGDGEVVFSSRAYPEGLWVIRNEGAEPIALTRYTLKRSVPK